MSIHPPASKSTSAPWIVQRRIAPAPPPIPTRRYNVCWLNRDGKVEEFSRTAPGVQFIQDAFAAMARGALIATRDGPVAIEDLLPGDEVITDIGPLPLLWKGSTMISGKAARLYRVAQDRFGLGKPVADLVLGPSARLVNRDSALRAAMGVDSVLAPISPMADGLSVIEVRPIAPVQVFHLGLDGHRIIRANGVETESMYPAELIPNHLNRSLIREFMQLCPHIEGFSDTVRLAMPRLSLEEFQQLLTV